MLHALIVQRSEDDHEPLMTTVQVTGSVEDCVGSWRQTIDEFLCDWWDITTSERFLKSSMSRRWLCWTVMPGLISLMIAGDFQINCSAIWISLDTCALIAFLLVPHLQLHRLWPDIIVIGVCATTSTVQFIMILYFGYNPTNDTITDALLLAYVSNMIWLFASAFSGIHASAVGGFALIMLIWWYMAFLSGHVLNYACFCVVFAVVVSFAVEVPSSWAFVLEEANRKLLDIGSDGFCTIDLQTGAVSLSSVSMQSLFGEVNLCGKQLTELVQSSDCAKVSELLTSSASSQAVLVTCVACQEQKVFDCKIVPYTRSPQKLGLCFQIQGEKRFMATDLFQRNNSNNLEAGSANGLESEQQHNPDSELTFSLTQAQSLASESAHPRHSGTSRREDIGVQVDPCIVSVGSPGHKDTGIQVKPSMICIDKATDPLFSWGEHGFECKRCAKPPLPSRGRVATRDRRSSRGRTDGSLSSESSQHSEASVRSSGRARAGERVKLSSGLKSFEDGLPQASGFRMTPLTTCELSISEMMLRWNCPRAACCPYHASVEAARLVVKLLKSRDCNPLWSPLTSGQCSACGAMADEQDEDGGDAPEQCEVCYTGVVIRVPAHEPDILSVASTSTDSRPAAE